MVLRLKYAIHVKISRQHACGNYIVIFPVSDKLFLGGDSKSKTICFGLQYTFQCTHRVFVFVNPSYKYEMYLRGYGFRFVCGKQTFSDWRSNGF